MRFPAWVTEEDSVAKKGKEERKKGKKERERERKTDQDGQRRGERERIL